MQIQNQNWTLFKPTFLITKYKKHLDDMRDLEQNNYVNERLLDESRQLDNWSSKKMKIRNRNNRLLSQQQSSNQTSTFGYMNHLLNLTTLQDDQSKFQTIDDASREDKIWEFQKNKKLQVSEREEEINRNAKLLSLVLYNKIQKRKQNCNNHQNITENLELPQTINKFSNLQKIFKSNHINVKLDFNQVLKPRRSQTEKKQEIVTIDQKERSLIRDYSQAFKEYRCEKQELSLKRKQLHELVQIKNEYERELIEMGNKKKDIQNLNDRLLEFLQQYQFRPKKLQLEQFQKLLSHSILKQSFTWTDLIEENEVWSIKSFVFDQCEKLKLFIEEIEQEERTLNEKIHKQEIEYFKMKNIFLSYEQTIQNQKDITEQTRFDLIQLYTNEMLDYCQDYCKKKLPLSYYIKSMWKVNKICDDLLIPNFLTQQQKNYILASALLEFNQEKLDQKILQSKQIRDAIDALENFKLQLNIHTDNFQQIQNILKTHMMDITRETFKNAFNDHSAQQKVQKQIRAMFGEQAYNMKMREILENEGNSKMAKSLQYIKFRYRTSINSNSSFQNQIKKGDSIYLENSTGKLAYHQSISMDK